MSVKKRTLKTENSTLFFTNAEIALEVHACSVTSNSLQPHGLYLIRPLCPWNFPGKHSGAGCHFLLQEIFLTQGWNQVPWICCTGRQILYHRDIWEAQPWK